MKLDLASSRIFISYRRRDSAGHVLALQSAFRNHFGRRGIFKTSDCIAPGINVLEFIQRELDS